LQVDQPDILHEIRAGREICEIIKGLASVEVAVKVFDLGFLLPDMGAAKQVSCFFVDSAFANLIGLLYQLQKRG
jgi:hypothetical protein